MRLAHPLIALAVVVGILGAPWGASALPSASAASASTRAAPGAVEDESSAVAIEIVPAASGIVRPGSDLSVSVILTNRSATTVDAGIARLYLDRSSTDDRAELEQWLTGLATDTTGADQVGEAPTPVLSPGESVALAAIVVPSAALAFEEQADFGAHRIAVTLEVAGTTSGGAHSSITADPGTGFTPTSIALAMPITVPASSSGLIPLELLSSLTSPTGLLSRQLDEATGQPVALGIDPRIIVSIRVLGASAPQSALDWLDRLALVPNPTFALGYADPDLAAVSQAGGGVLAPTPFALDPAQFPTTVDATPSPSASPSATPTADRSTPDLTALLEWGYTLDGIAWPRDDTVVATDLPTFAAGGLNTTILSSTNAASVAQSQVVPASAEVGEHAVLSSDAMLSRLFRDAASATSDAQWQGALARLAAGLAVVSDRGSDGGIVLATLDRRVPFGSPRLAETIAAVSSLPWAETASFATAIAEPATPITLVDRPIAAERVTQFGYLLASELSTTQFSSVAIDPSLVTGERRLSLLALASQSWSAELVADGWATAVAEYLARSSEILQSVQVVSSNTINLFADSGTIQVPVSNVLDFPVTVFVDVRPQSAIIDVRESRVEVTVEPNSQNNAAIPVQFIANGEVTVAISLSSAAGVPIGQVSYADINVRAGWETAATAVLAVIVAGIFVAGIVRTVRRRRRLASTRDEDSDPRPDEVGDARPEPDAASASPAEHSG